MAIVNAGANSITVSFNSKIMNDVYTVHVSGGPTAVTDFQVTLPASGSAEAIIPTNGTNSPLGAGTYNVKVTRNADGNVEKFSNIVVPPP